MSFLENVLPVDVRPGASGGPGFSTTVQQLRGGGEYRNRLWQHPLHTYELEYGVRSVERVEQDLKQFILETAGAFSGFRARDWSDYSVTKEQISVGDGTTYWFRLYKDYGNYQRRILKPDPTTVTIYVNGSTVPASEWAIDSDNGTVIFADPPALNQVIAWTGEFHVPVRFMEDNMSIQMLIHTKGAVRGLGLRELRLRENINETDYDTIRDFLNEINKADLFAMLDALDIHVNTNWPATDNQP